MSSRRMLFIVVLALAAAVAAPAAAADLEPADLSLLGIFADPAVSSAEPAPALQPGVEVQERSSCSPEGAKMWVWTGVCCIAARQEQEQYVCTGGVWVLTGSIRCWVPTCGP